MSGDVPGLLDWWWVCLCGDHGSACVVVGLLVWWSACVCGGGPACVVVCLVCLGGGGLPRLLGWWWAAASAWVVLSCRVCLGVVCSCVCCAPAWGCHGCLGLQRLLGLGPLCLLGCSRADLCAGGAAWVVARLFVWCWACLGGSVHTYCRPISPTHQATLQQFLDLTMPRSRPLPFDPEVARPLLPA